MTVRRSRSRWMLGVVAALVALGIVGVAGSVQQTQAAWSDRTYVSAVATGGKWNAPSNSVGCTAMNADGTPMAGGFCSVTSVDVAAEWGTAPNRTRNYTATFNSNAGAGYIQFSINLSTANGATGSFSWGNAGLSSSSNQAAPTNGWTCAKLPWLTAKTPTNWGWGASSTIYFQVVENRSASSVTCA